MEVHNQQLLQEIFTDQADETSDVFVRRIKHLADDAPSLHTLVNLTNLYALIKRVKSGQNVLKPDDLELLNRLIPYIK